MNTLAIGFRIALPKGATLGEPREFYVSMYKLNDTYVECLPMTINGCDVQILRYDCDDDSVIVFIGNRAKEMTMDEVGDYIRANT